ncbi:hypothetical protein [Bradyrhizobium sp. RD5-C2]|uniref:hypothetical protein n=1 Tax=Bradyrhizobium sp. RD5-C2 TaxID=244562 RepID=UPI001CC69B11|nr:hypothetical protein [Bradyrhizobium sp. RD5-C2]
MANAASTVHAAIFSRLMPGNPPTFDLRIFKSLPVNAPSTDGLIRAEEKAPRATFARNLFVP